VTDAASSSAGPRLLGPAEVRLLAAELDLRPTKQRGQNFVIDANTVRRIVRAAKVSTDDVVLEVGPGLGSLTLGLLRRALGDRGRQRAGEHRVDLDGRDRVDCLEERQREGAQARSDLEDDVVRRHLGGTHDAAHRVGVDDEVLPQRLGRP